MSSPEHHIQVLYELSLSVGAKGDLTETARTALSAYLRKLNCSAGAVFERRDTRDGGVNYETVTMIPSRAAVCAGFEAAIARLADARTDDAAFQASLPITGESEDGATYYIMELPDFGVLVLVTRKQPLDGETVAALRPLNEKLATACRGERYEGRLREERDRFEAIFSTIDEPLASVRLEAGEMLVQRINPAFESTFGYDETQALDRPLERLLGPGPTEDDAFPDLDGVDGTDYSATTKLCRETAGGTSEFLLRVTPISPDTDGTEHLALFVDITEAVSRQRRLERFHEVTKALSRILRHNIRNDLTVIQAMAERIRDGTDGPPAEDARAILRKSEQLASTAEKAREMRELVATHDDQSSVPLDVAVTDAVNSVRHDYPSAEIDVEIDVPEGTTLYPSLGIAVRHLVENGIEHHEATAHGTIDADTEPTPRVTVTVESNAATTTVTVRDNASGIPEAEIAMLERGSETPLEHGSGAGLWIVGQIMNYCDATLDFTSGESGTTATITVEH